uniref:TIGR03032 family protein n=1 Tax=uncultured Rhizobium sp. TaxID=155567 RepID=UPI0026236DD9
EDKRPAERTMEVTASSGFKRFLMAHRASIALTTYQSGRLLVVSGNSHGDRLHFCELKFKRPMGMAVQDGMLAIGLQNQVLTYADIMRSQTAAIDDADALYIPKVSNYTTDIDIHDVAFGGDGQLYFVNTQFSCLCTTSNDHSFKPFWKPPFITQLKPEDRCHLNGMAIQGGVPAYATVCGRSNEKMLWKQDRDLAGCVYDVRTDEVVCAGLTMPHSPRWNDGKLWVLNSGHGEIGTVDLQTRTFQPLAFLPGYLRGLSFIGKYAVVGVSKPRDKSVFSGLPLQAEMERRGMKPVCGLFVIDTETGHIEHRLTFEGAVSELYDTAVLAGLDRPSFVSLDGEEKGKVVSIEPGLAPLR